MIGEIEHDSLIEKLIKYEAVHDIRSWADLKNRLDSDRRCYGFFHPRLPNTPLIFVEVALVDRISDGIVPLLDETTAPTRTEKSTTAIFYSISNTQAGLRGVSFGDSLIKRVVETLQAELPRLKVFATLSPIPGFRAWLDTVMRDQGAKLPDLSCLKEPDWFRNAAAAERVRQPLMGLCAHYLTSVRKNDEPHDPVARFHLANGASLERLNWRSDLSEAGMRRSFGLTVNYVYELNHLDRNHERGNDCHFFPGFIRSESDVWSSRPTAGMDRRDTDATPGASSDRARLLHSADHRRPQPNRTPLAVVDRPRPRLHVRSAGYRLNPVQSAVCRPADGGGILAS